MNLQRNEYGARAERVRCVLGEHWGRAVFAAASLIAYAFVLSACAPTSRNAQASSSSLEAKALTIAQWVAERHEPGNEDDSLGLADWMKIVTGPPASNWMRIRRTGGHLHVAGERDTSKTRYRSCHGGLGWLA
jgi:hypothetical protein